MKCLVVESTAESQGHDEVQEAMKVRSALANGTFKWTECSLAAMKDGHDKLRAPTMRLDDCHPTPNKEPVVEIFVIFPDVCDVHGAFVFLLSLTPLCYFQHTHTNPDRMWFLFTAVKKALVIC